MSEHQTHGGPGHPGKKFPRTLFVLKLREDPYGSYNGGDTYGREDGPHWGDNTPDRKPLSSGLFNSARMVVDMLEQQGVPVKLVHVVDNNTINREIIAFGAELVIIEAFWVVPDKFDVLLEASPNVKFVIRNHSESPFLANEGIAFDWTLKYVGKPNVIMSCNAPRMMEETRFLAHLAYPELSPVDIRNKVVYLPNFYPIPDATQVGQINEHDLHVDVGCFGAVRPLKNHMLQAIAALKFATKIGKRLRFHINGGRIEMGGSPILKNLVQLFDHFPNHELVMHKWKDHIRFKELVASMDLLTQVSFSETFNIIAADAITQGVATVTSSEIPWSSHCFRAEATSSESIAEMMHKAYRIKLKVPRYNPSLKGLRRYDTQSTEVWTAFLHNFAISR